MRTSTGLSLSALFLRAVSAVISPEYHSIVWKFEDSNFWAPLGLNTTAFALESPAGSAPAGLNKRTEPKGVQYLPCTVVTLDTGLSGGALNSTLAAYSALKDDVWSEAQFMECLFIQTAGNATSTTDIASLSSFIAENELSYVFVSSAYNVTGLVTAAAVYPVPSSCALANGPYAVTLSPCETGLSVTPVYGLHEDVYESFMSGAIPNAAIPGAHLTMQVSVPGTREPAIIVPSRIASAITTGQVGPLAGLRFATKDIFHITGLKTSGGSRAYYQVYAPQNYTTQTVEKSLAGGAQLIGKTKTIAFALGAPGNGAEIDYLDPWNSRGDGYQTTGGSSSGSGSAVTAYDWVDFTIGSDTGGSVRFPARFGGLYGYKPTHGAFNTTGVLVAIAEQDTPGFLTRSPSIFTKLGKWWAKDTILEAEAETLMPSNLLYFADEPALVQPEAEAMKLDFFAKVAASLNMSTSSVNVTERWNAVGPSNGVPISEYMEYVYSDQNSIQFYDAIGKPLADLYSSYNNGSFFPADPMVNASWYDALNETTIARAPTSIKKRELFAEFWNGNVMKASNATCSESFFAHSLHIAPGMEKVTHDAVSVATYYWAGVNTNYAGIPEIVVPIGQIKYFSPYTLREEWQPVTVAFAAALGCDLKLFELVEKLEGLGLLKETLPGKVAYYTDELW